MDLQFHLLEAVTNGFSDEQKVGSGGHADVYKCICNGKEMALKKLHPLQALDDKAFDTAFSILSKVKHKNVVQFLGYCYQVVSRYVPYNGEVIFATETERIFCFEYMEGGSLGKYIADEYCSLDWDTCYQIIKGACDGLNHLHGAYEKPIFHLNLKPSNILMDKNMTAKVADFGLSRLADSTETHETLGYMPPEYMEGGCISEKFDVFSLGVIILKIVAGNKGHYLCYEMSLEQFTKHVTENWERRLQGSSGYSSHEEDILQLKDIFHELEEFEGKMVAVAPKEKELGEEL